ncbi:hypothetical protein TNCT_353441 [Trichonephila clavata]|uniref:Uncharacterized protein n=1 Tax=Trichonephila clavata TaxID=2740835 RepID=A0A8X6GPC8_TRICU|nr:hypothetical protein TNCT_353441 [Trichonephila clavata]
MDEEKSERPVKDLAGESEKEQEDGVNDVIQVSPENRDAEKKKGECTRKSLIPVLSPEWKELQAKKLQKKQEAMKESLIPMLCLEWKEKRLETLKKEEDVKNSAIPVKPQKSGIGKEKENFEKSVAIPKKSIKGKEKEDSEKIGDKPKRSDKAKERDYKQKSYIPILKTEWRRKEQNTLKEEREDSECFRDVPGSSFMKKEREDSECFRDVPGSSFMKKEREDSECFRDVPGSSFMKKEREDSECFRDVPGSSFMKKEREEFDYYKQEPEGSFMEEGAEYFDYFAPTSEEKGGEKKQAMIHVLCLERREAQIRALMEDRMLIPVGRDEQKNILNEDGKTSEHFIIQELTPKMRDLKIEALKQEWEDLRNNRIRFSSDSSDNSEEEDVESNVAQAKSKKIDIGEKRENMGRALVPVSSPEWRELQMEIMKEYEFLKRVREQYTQESNYTGKEVPNIDDIIKQFRPEEQGSGKKRSYIPVISPEWRAERLEELKREENITKNPVTPKETDSGKEKDFGTSAITVTPKQSITNQKRELLRKTLIPVMSPGWRKDDKKVTKKEEKIEKSGVSVTPKKGDGGEKEGTETSRPVELLKKSGARKDKKVKEKPPNSVGIVASEDEKEKEDLNTVIPVSPLTGDAEMKRKYTGKSLIPVLTEQWKMDQLKKLQKKEEVAKNSAIPARPRTGGIKKSKVDYGVYGIPVKPKKGDIGKKKVDSGVCSIQVKPKKGETGKARISSDVCRIPVKPKKGDIGMGYIKSGISGIPVKPKEVNIGKARISSDVCRNPVKPKEVNIGKARISSDVCRNPVKPKEVNIGKARISSDVCRNPVKPKEVNIGKGYIKSGISGIPVKPKEVNIGKARISFDVCRNPVKPKEVNIGKARISSDVCRNPVKPKEVNIGKARISSDVCRNPVKPKEVNIGKGYIKSGISGIPVKPKEVNIGKGNVDYGLCGIPVKPKKGDIGKKREKKGKSLIPEISSEWKEQRLNELKKVAYFNNTFIEII